MFAGLQDSACNLDHIMHRALGYQRVATSVLHHSVQELLQYSRKLKSETASALQAELRWGSLEKKSNPSTMYKQSARSWRSACRRIQRPMRPVCNHSSGMHPENVPPTRPRARLDLGLLRHFSAHRYATELEMQFIFSDMYCLLPVQEVAGELFALQGHAET